MRKPNKPDTKAQSGLFKSHQSYNQSCLFLQWFLSLYSLPKLELECILLASTGHGTFFFFLWLDNKEGKKIYLMNGTPEYLTTKLHVASAFLLFVHLPQDEFMVEKLIQKVNTNSHHCFVCLVRSRSVC